MRQFIDKLIYGLGKFTLGLIVAVIGLSLGIYVSSGGKKKADDSARPKAAQVVVMEDKKPETVALVSASANDEAKSDGTASSSCLCADDVTCKGPRGGTYCIREDGKKRYR